MVRSARVYGTFVGPLVLTAACTSILGIDQTYVVGVSTGTGGRHHVDVPDSAAGGSSGSGGDTPVASGGTTESGGEPGSGGTLDASKPADAGPCAHCAAGEKCCVSTCVKPGPLFGCSLNNCETCLSLPKNATGVCNGDQCGFACIAGFTEQGGACIATAGTGGAPGTGGTTAKCVATQCPACPGGLIYSACCQANGECGCSFPFAPCAPQP